MNAQKKFLPLWFELGTGEFFDQPSSARLLSGLVSGFNRLVEEYADTVSLEIKQDKTIFVALNCLEDKATKI